jgi:hypothetical protein
MTTIAGNSAYALENVATGSNIREDLGNVIYNVTPYQTPFSSGVAKTRATNDNHEWLTDTLADTAPVFKIEADTVGDASTDGRTRKGNFVGILQETATVTKKAEMFDRAGIPGKEMAYQLLKKGKELQMTMEKSLLLAGGGVIKVAPTNSTAGVPAPVSSWIETNQDIATNGTLNGASTGLTNTVLGDNRTFEEVFLTGILDGVWKGSGDFSNVAIMADAARVTSIREKVNGMAGADGMTTDVSAGNIYNRIAIYESQFGPVKVVPNKHMPGNQIYVLDMSTWGIAFGGGKTIHTTELSTSTSAEKQLLETYFTLEARSEEANGAVYSIS